MRRLLIWANFTVRRAICRFFGHCAVDMALADVGFRQCMRCLRIVEYKTVRRRVTFGDVERRMAATAPKGYRFISCNWKKRKMKFVSASGGLKFVSF
jgi:hypothetical protein